MYVFLGEIYLEVGAGGGDFQLSENPDSVGEFEGHVQHVLAVDVAFGDRENVVILQLLRNSV